MQGVPVWFVAQQFKVPNQALRVHAWCHNWWRRRSLNLPSPKHLLTMLALARLRNTWHLADSGSAERSLALLVKLSGVGEQEPTERELINYCRERLANYKVPRKVVFRDSLPRGGTGKILKRLLRKEMEMESSH